MTIAETAKLEKRLSNIGRLGAGLAHRRELNRSLLDGTPDVDFLEIIAEKYMTGSSVALDALCALGDRYVLVPHGLGLSIATAGRVSSRALQSMRQVCQLTRAPYYSDHLAVTAVPGIDIGHLTPTIYDRNVLQQVISNVNQVQDALGIPFVIENIAETHFIRAGELELPDFMERLTEATGCGLLLDVTNLYINAVNAGRDPIEQALKMPLHTVVQVHLAGGKSRGGKLLDTHSEAVPQPVWRLFEALVPRLTQLKAAIIERDGDFPEFSSLLEEVGLARQIMGETAPDTMCW